MPQDSSLNIEATITPSLQHWGQRPDTASPPTPIPRASSLRHLLPCRVQPDLLWIQMVGDAGNGNITQVRDLAITLQRPQNEWARP